ncbi:MAG: hypothetical protein RLT30_01880, partial [Gammaproteobacteria bacterium]
TLSRTPVFKTGAFNHSATSPVDLSFQRFTANRTLHSTIIPYIHVLHPRFARARLTAVQIC